MNSTAANEGRVALITGGGTGIGYACAAALVGAGYSVVINGRRKHILDDAVERLRRDSPEGGIEARSADVGEPDQATNLVADVVRDLGRLDALVCAAAIYEARPVDEIDADTWDRVLNVALRGYALCSFVAARQMRKQAGGRIVLIASTTSIMSEPQQAPYNAAKAGVVSLARSMAVELSADGIVVNAVSPGWVRTPMTEADLADVPAEVMQRICPTARAAEPEEIANLVRYLVTEAPEFLTGSSIVIDGGQTAMAAMP
jgi:NAD(P)-dependent dehydrogenase (short-subunit alcohol dehydrogenase family)